MRENCTSRSVRGTPGNRRSYHEGLQFNGHLNVKILTVFILLMIAVASVVSLVSGASFLGTPLPGGLPAGNAIAASGLVSPAVLAVLLSSRGSLLRVVAFGSLGAALAWLPVSIALAGNLALNFTGWRGSVWLGFSFVVCLAVLFALVWALVHRLGVMRQRASAD